ncbi:hypothetical protein D3C87_97840 [compost metagenome]
MKRKLIIFALLAIFSAGNNNLNAQTPFSPNSYSGWLSTPNNYFANLPAAPGVTFTHPVRGTGNQFSTAADGMNSGQWLNASAADAITANRYFTFSAKADATTTFTIDSISLILGSSATGPDSCLLQYKSPGTGYNFVSFASSVHITLNATTTLLLTPASSITIPAGDSIVFRLTAWHAPSTLGKLKIMNNSRLFGSAITTVANSITAPLVQTSDAICVSSVKGDSVQVTFNSSGTFNTGNTYSLELSDAGGSFSSPLVIGTITSNSNNGTINGFIPSGTLSADYRLRVKSSDPVVEGTDTTQLTVNPGLVLTASVLQPACADSLGAIDLTMNGGSGTIQYIWSNGSNAQDQIQLPGGVIGVGVVDSLGCSVDSSFQIITIPAFNVTETISDVLCHSADNGEISVTISGGTSPYTASWTGNGITETGLTVTDLPAGQYELTVSDANNCQYTATYTVTEAAAVSVSAVTVHASCASCTGTVTITPNGGIAPYTYLWENGVTASTITGIPGEYCVTISDANGCEKDTCFIISSTAGIEDHAANSFTQVFPNPASDVFSLNFPSALNGVKKEIRIVNLAGQTVFQNTINSEIQVVDVENWAPGSYIYQVQTESNLFESGKINVIN